MLLHRLLFSLALTGPSSLTEHREDPGAESHGPQPSIPDLIESLGAPLLAATTAEEFDIALAQALAAPDLRDRVVELAHLAFHTDVPSLTADDLNATVDRTTARFGEPHRWQVRQIIDMFLEILDRSSTMVDSLLRVDDSILESELHRFARGDSDTDRPWRLVLVNFLCNSAAALAVEDARPLSPEVAAVLLTRWYDSTRDMLAEIDPIQRILDDIHRQIRGQHPQILRMTYSRDDSDDGKLVISVWFLLDDDTQLERNVALISDPHLRHRLHDELAEQEPELHWVLRRIRLASEAGPSEDFLQA